jgi:hypothetical protein
VEAAVEAAAAHHVRTVLSLMPKYSQSLPLLYGTLFASLKLMTARIAIFFSLTSVGRKSTERLGGMAVDGPIECLFWLWQYYREGDMVRYINGGNREIPGRWKMGAGWWGGGVDKVMSRRPPALAQSLCVTVACRISFCTEP